jgi:hypothetical protein
MKARTQQTVSTVKSKHGFIDAIVVHHQDFSSYVNMRNLLIFLLDRTSKLTDTEQLTICSTQISQTASYLKNFIGAADRDHDLMCIIGDIVDETEILIKMIDSFISNNSDFEIQTLITARSTQIHWLCVCGLEELNRNLPPLH